MSLEKLNLFSEIIHSISGGLIVLDDRGHIILWNQWIEKVSGKKCDGVEGKRLQDVFPEIADTRLMIEIEKSIKRGTSAMLSCHLNKRLFPLYLSSVDQSKLSPMAHNVQMSAIQYGAGFACMIQISDQSSAVQREKSLRRAKEMAEQATRVKADFLATMSHEIRTPLNGIIGAADVLDTLNSVVEKDKEYLDIIRLSGQSLLKLLNDILDLSKLENQSMELEEVHFCLTDLVDEVMRLFKASYRERDIQVEWSVSPDVPQMIKLDALRLKQILFNLVGNAFKFTSEGSVKVTVELVYAEKAPMIAFKIQDTGIGISEENQKELFRRFKQVNNSIARTHGGTGLGLAICHELVTLMKGEIELDSRLGDGSCFTVMLPFLYKEDLLTITADDDQIDTDKPLSSLPNLSILLAEDNEINQRYFNALFDIYGQNATIVANGRKAVQVMQTATIEDFDLVLMDLQMPELSGTEATTMIRSIKSEISNIPIVALTAFRDKGVVEKCLAAGMNAVVEKPLDEYDFVHTIKRVLSENSHWRQKVS